MEFGMPTLIENSSLEETVALCSELNLQFVELNMNLPQYQVEKLEDVTYLKEIARKNNIYFTIHLDENLNVCDFNHAVTNAYLETVKRTIQVAKELKVPVLNMHMNHGVHFTLPDRKVQLFEQYSKEYMGSIATFRKLCEDTIGEAEIKICIENTDGFREYEKNAIEYLLKSKVFALTWDIGHSNSCHNIDEAFIRSHEEKLCHFHIHDSLGAKDHMTLGTGEVDLEGRITIAERHNCRCVLETKTIEALRESVEWIKHSIFSV